MKPFSSAWNEFTKIVLVKKQTRVRENMKFVDVNKHFNKLFFRLPSSITICSNVSGGKKRRRRKWREKNVKLKLKNILFMSIKIYLWKHFQFAPHNQSFMIFSREQRQGNINFLSSHSHSAKGVSKKECCASWGVRGCLSVFAEEQDTWWWTYVFILEALHHSELT